MRLIDADALDIMLADAQSTCKKNGGNFRFGVLNSVRANFANQPTVDAIPVEWINALTNHSDMFTRGAAKWVLGCWKKEQEAK